MPTLFAIESLLDLRIQQSYQKDLNTGFTQRIKATSNDSICKLVSNIVTIPKLNTWDSENRRSVTTALGTIKVNSDIW